MDQCREALRALRKGSEHWRLVDERGSIEVKFRIRGRVEHSSSQPDPSKDHPPGQRTREEGDPSTLTHPGSSFRACPLGVTGIRPGSKSERATPMENVHPDQNCQATVKRMEEALSVRRYAQRTRKSYLQWLRRYLGWCGEQQLPHEWGDSLKRFLEMLALDRQVSASTQNQALCAILFFLQQVEGYEIAGIDAVRARRGRRLP
ncbi:MAG: site-specific integrase [Verrucomicrobiota bacterium]